MGNMLSQMPLWRAMWRTKRLLPSLLFGLLTCHEGTDRLVAASAKPPSPSVQKHTAMTIHPLKLKELSDRYVVVVLDSDTPFFIRKDAPETAAVQQAVRGALDLMKNVTISVAVDDPHRIIAAHIDHPEERAAPRCPDRDELTSAFFSRQESIPSLPRDQVRWVSKIPGCASYRVSFVRAAAFSWIHPQHPRASAMLAVAWRSINEDLYVQASVCGTAQRFLADLKLD